MHKHWQPLYHADVARDFGEAKLEFAGSAQLSYSYRSLYLNPQSEAIIAGLPDPVMRETLVDYFLNTGFRKDVFVRGARKMSKFRRAAVMARFGVALLVPREEIKMKISMPVGAVDGLPAIFNPICDALAERPHTVVELSRLPLLKLHNLESIIQAVALLAGSNQVALFENELSSLDVRPALRMNLALAEQTRYDDDYQTLCSPLLGSGISASYIERLVYFLMLNLPESEGKYDLQALTQQGWAHMEASGRTMVKDGAKLTDTAANMIELQAHIQKILETKLPLWRQLKML
jgi:hypothetical protein